jgi:malonyl-CoA O-methyltransferase
MNPSERPDPETQLGNNAGIGIDPHAARRRFDRAARHQLARHRLSRERAPHSLAQTAPVGLLDDEVAQRMAQRLDWVRIQPARILDAGCGAGDARVLLSQRYPDASWLGLDSSSVMLALARAKSAGHGSGWPGLRQAWTLGLQGLRAALRTAWRTVLATALRRHAQAWQGLIAADISALPLQPGSVGLVWSNLALPWAVDLSATLRELHRVLEPGGLLTFSSYGPDTLKELRLALHEPGERDGRGAQTDARLHPFVDMHDLGDQLVQAGFAAPVMDMEIIRLSWPNAAACLLELHHSGQGNALFQRPRGLRTPRAWQALCDRLQQQAGDADGRVSLSFEIVYGHAWRPQPREARRSAAQPAVIQFQRRPPPAPPR